MSCNNYVGGIDSSDMMMYCYLYEWSLVKYWRKVTFNVFGQIILNLYILCEEV